MVKVGNIRSKICGWCRYILLSAPVTAVQKHNTRLRYPRLEPLHSAACLRSLEAIHGILFELPVARGMPVVHVSIF